MKALKKKGFIDQGSTLVNIPTQQIMTGPFHFIVAVP